MITNKKYNFIPSLRKEIIIAIFKNDDSTLNACGPLQCTKIIKRKSLEIVMSTLRPEEKYRRDWWKKGERAPPLPSSRPQVIGDK